MEKITWPAAIVVIAALAAIVGLVSLGQDLTAVGVVIAGMLGLNAMQQASTKEKVEKVESNTNGSNKVLIDALLRDRQLDRELIRQALMALPPGTQLNLPPGYLADDATQVLPTTIAE